MPPDVGQDQLALIRVEGMHCHKCERAIQQAMLRLPGVHEVEVDFASGQASVLHDRNSVTVKEMLQAVEDAGYRVVGFTQNSPGPAAP